MPETFHVSRQTPGITPEIWEWLLDCARIKSPHIGVVVMISGSRTHRELLEKLKTVEIISKAESDARRQE